MAPSYQWPWQRNDSTPKKNAFNLNPPYLTDVSPPVLILSAFALGGLSSASAIFVYSRYGRRLRTSDWVTPNYLRRTRWIRGVVTAVGDADNFRLYHTPPFGWSWPFKFRRVPTTVKDLKDQTLHIRIAGVDAPEGAHFGRPAQPHSTESLEWLRSTILGKAVYCQLLRRDQYGRIVSHVTLPPRLLPASLTTGELLSIKMLDAGCVTTYEQAGAEYGKWGKDSFLQAERAARAARRGMWANGTTIETPSEYKRRHANAATLEEAEAARTKTHQPAGGKEQEQKGGLRRWLAWLGFGKE